VAYVYLSYELGVDTPVFGVNDPVEVTVHRGFDEGPFLQHLVSTVNHNGTHVDVPVHFHQGGSTLSDLAAGTWHFTRPAVVDLAVRDDQVVESVVLAAALEHVDREIDALLLRTGFGAVRDADKERYCSANPGFSQSAANYLRGQFARLRAVFCDIPSFSAAKHPEEGTAWHRAMLDESTGSFVLLFEDVNLPAGLLAPREIWAVPLRLAGLDGAPVTVIADV
jgi:kynurenine formamidase